MTDANLSKAVCTLIEQEDSRLAYDNTFGMLYDMAPERVENQVLIPVLEKIENNRPQNEEKYVYYFKFLFLGITVHNASEDNEEASWKLSVRVGLRTQATLCLDILMEKYDCDQREIDYRLLAERMQKNAKRRTDNRIEYTIEEILEDQPVFDLLRNSWIGFYAEKMSMWLDDLYIQRKESEKDLCSILDL